MALVNVAAELAQRGRRVLAVDFDLEAPGLDTFDLPRPPGSTPGIVDFVGEYLSTGQAPAVKNFVFESKGVGSGGGGLWIMPSGAHLDTYANTLASIEWSELYEEHDGFLLFEDLKEQWRNDFKPDYVLIDSRTGHTDVGGICTRQLPDAVAILFFPNLQNLRGLTKVVRDIRSEASLPRKNSIHLHFIMSNVPDLDDEDRILEASISSFEEGLGFDDPLIIHRYDSLALLNQVIFTKDRPRSRLAKEYRSVSAEIMRNNPRDRDGALDFLDNVAPLRGVPHPGENWVRQWDEIENHLNSVERSHQGDGEVLSRLGFLRNRMGRPKEAAELFDKSIKARWRVPEVYLSRARIRKRDLGDTVGAHKDAANVISATEASPGQVLQALSIIGVENLKRDVDLFGLLSKPPQERVWIAGQLDTSRAEAEVVRVMLQPLLADSQQPEDIDSRARHILALSSIAVGSFADAVAAIQGEESNVQAMGIVDAFNYGMALWGETRQIVQEPFERVLEIDRVESDEFPSPNRLQCMAVAHWAVGEIRQAEVLAKRATREIRSRAMHEFSCWRYLRVPRSEFEQDITELLGLIGGDQSVKPRFLLPSE